MTTLYQDEKFVLNLVAEDICKLEFIINENTYHLTSRHFQDNEPCICIKSLDGAVNIVMQKAIHIAFVISNLMSGKQIRSWRHGLLTSREFCELIEAEIVRSQC